MHVLFCNELTETLTESKLRTIYDACINFQSGGSPVHFSLGLGEDDDSLSYGEKFSKGLLSSEDDISALVSPRFLSHFGF